MVTAGILPFTENSHSRAGNRTRDLMISMQRLWPLDHEAGQIREYTVRSLSGLSYFSTLSKKNDKILDEKNMWT